MATALVDDLPPSYEQALAMIERWESTTLADDEKMKHQQEVLNVLSDTTMAGIFTEQCENIGKTAAAVDRAFEKVKISFDDIVKNYIKDFPEVKGYAAQWDGFRERWNGNDGGLLWASRKLATFTASQLNLYNNVFLKMVEEIKSEQDLKDAQAELKNFSTKKYPIDIKPDIADGFKILRNDIQDFTKNFQKYIKDKKQKLDDKATEWQGVIKGLQGDIETLNGQINKVLIGLGCSVVFGIVGVLIATAMLGGFLMKRAEKEGKLADAQRQLEEVNRKQKALAHMQSDFDNLKPDIELICNKLAIFAEVWASARSQAVDFANKLDAGQKVTTQAAFKLTLKLARKTSSVLMEGLKAYATYRPKVSS